MFLNQCSKSGFVARVWPMKFSRRGPTMVISVISFPLVGLNVRGTSFGCNRKWSNPQTTNPSHETTANQMDFNLGPPVKRLAHDGTHLSPFFSHFSRGTPKKAQKSWVRKGAGRPSNPKRHLRQLCHLGAQLRTVLLWHQANSAPRTSPDVAQSHSEPGRNLLSFTESTTLQLQVPTHDQVCQ